MADILHIDELKLYFGDDIYINKYIKIHSPSVGEIVDYGEQEYFSTVHLLTAIPSDMKSQLFDLGIDYEEISDFELFYLLTRNLSPERTGIFFYDLDLSKMELTRNEENGLLIMQSDQGILDELAHKKIAKCLCKIHSITPKVEHAKTKTVKKILIEEDRKRLKRLEKEESKSVLKDLISAMMRYPGFKYKTSELKDCSYYEFMDSVQGAQIYVQSTALLQGSYSGMIDTSKINKNEFNWMRNPSEIEHKNSIVRETTTKK